jgi:hypothetical protein
LSDRLPFAASSAAPAWPNISQEAPRCARAACRDSQPWPLRSPWLLLLLPAPTTLLLLPWPWPLVPRKPPGWGVGSGRGSKYATTRMELVGGANLSALDTKFRIT